MKRLNMNQQMTLAALIILATSPLNAAPIAPKMSGSAGNGLGIAAPLVTGNAGSMSLPASSVLATLNGMITPLPGVTLTGAQSAPVSPQILAARAAAVQAIEGRSIVARELKPGLRYVMDEKGQEYLVTAEGARAIDSSNILDDSTDEGQLNRYPGKPVESYSPEEHHQNAALSQLRTQLNSLKAKEGEAAADGFSKGLIREEMASRQAYLSGKASRVLVAGRYEQIMLQKYHPTDYDRALALHNGAVADIEATKAKDADRDAEAFIAAGQWNAATYTLAKNLKADLTAAKEARRTAESMIDMKTAAKMGHDSIGGAAEAAGRMHEAVAAANADIAAIKAKLAALSEINPNLKPWHKRALPEFQDERAPASSIEPHPYDPNHNRTRFGTMAKTESGWKMVRPAVGLWKMTRTEILASLAFVASIPGVVIGTLASVSTQSPYDAGLLFFFGMSGITVVSSLYFLAGIGRDGISRRAYYRFRHTHAGKTYSATPAGVKIQIPSTSRAGIVESN